MNISHREYSNSFIELTIETDDNTAKIVEDITNIDGTVDTDLIQQLRDIADSLEEWNRKKDLINTQ